MENVTSLSKQKRKKNALSDSEEEELLKKHKTIRSGDESRKEESENPLMTKDVSDSSELMEGNQNGEYKKPPTRGLSDSESAGTDVELTSDEETPLTYQKTRKKRRISIKSEKKSINDVQLGSSSESEDDRPNSPKSPSSVKKFYRKRKSFPGNKSHTKVSSDSESYKTESDSDNAPLKQKSRKPCATSHKRNEQKKSCHESPQGPEKCEVKALQKNVLENESSFSEGDSNFQKKTNRLLKGERKQVIKEEQTLSDDKTHDSGKNAKRIVMKTSDSSSDEGIDPARRQRERELRRQKKRGYLIKGNVSTTKRTVLQKSDDNPALDSDGSSDYLNTRDKIKEELESVANSAALNNEKEIKQEEPSSDSGSGSGDKQVSGKEKLKNNNSQPKKEYNSAIASSSEVSDNEVLVKDKVKKEQSEIIKKSESQSSQSSEEGEKEISVECKLKKEKSEKTRRSSSSTSSHKNKKDNDSSSSESEKPKSKKLQKLKREVHSSSSDLSDNEVSVTEKIKNEKSKKVKKSEIQKSNSRAESETEISVESKLKEVKSGKKRRANSSTSSSIHKKDNGSSSSESEKPKSKKQQKTKRKTSSATSSSSESSDKEVSVKGKVKKEQSEKMKKSESQSSQSSEESEKEIAVESKLKKEKSEKKRRSSSSTSSHKNQKDNTSSSSESDKPKSKKQQKRKQPDEDKRIISLKKYLKTAGIRVNNYSELWKDCRSNKARAQKMLSLLEQNGLKGRPTIEKCKKLRKKIETRKEVEELDLSNVMDCGEGRTRRSRINTSGSQEFPDFAEKKASEIKRRLQALADSD